LYLQLLNYAHAIIRRRANFDGGGDATFKIVLFLFYSPTSSLFSILNLNKYDCFSYWFWNCNDSIFIFLMNTMKQINTNNKFESIIVASLSSYTYNYSVPTPTNKQTDPYIKI
jgi:hypothetical protein